MAAERLLWPQLGEEASLAQEAAAREVELRVLRVEAQAMEREAAQLREQVRDADLRLLEASGTVGTLSAQVEATAGNRHAVLEASAQQLDGQAAGLRRRLARLEWELAEKDEEISTLRQAAQAKARQVGEQKATIAALQRSEWERNCQAAVLVREAESLQRHQAVGEWREHVQAQIAQEGADAALVRERRSALQELDTLEEEMTTLRAVIARCEDKCKHHAGEIAARRQHYDALLMEDRLCTSAGRLGQETADEQQRSQIVEHRMLEAQLHEERRRRAMSEPSARAYDMAEESAMRAQGELAALTACMREISRTLHEPASAVGQNERLDALMDAFLRSAHETGVNLPPIDRVGPGAFTAGGELLQCELSDGGRLCVREPGSGGLMLIQDFFRRRSSHDGSALPPPMAGTWGAATAPISRAGMVLAV